MVESPCVARDPLVPIENSLGDLCDFFFLISIFTWFLQRRQI